MPVNTKLRRKQLDSGYIHHISPISNLRYVPPGCHILYAPGLWSPQICTNSAGRVYPNTHSNPSKQHRLGQVEEVNGKA